MRILDFLFGRRPAAEATAGIAKERLQIVLSHERASRDAPSFLPALQRDLAHHHGMWRHPETDNDFLDPAWYEHVARVLEKGKFDCLFFADTLGLFDNYRGIACDLKRLWANVRNVVQGGDDVFNDDFGCGI